jgi:hypothetical protein
VYARGRVVYAHSRLVCEILASAFAVEGRGVAVGTTFRRLYFPAVIAADGHGVRGGRSGVARAAGPSPSEFVEKGDPRCCSLGVEGRVVCAKNRMSRFAGAEMVSCFRGTPRAAAKSRSSVSMPLDAKSAIGFPSPYT